MSYNYIIFQNAAELPFFWDEVVAAQNILLSESYFSVLDAAAPENMTCLYAGFYLGEELIGGAVFQFLDFQAHKTFQNNELFCNLRNWLAKKFSKSVMIIGNNMLTGQNGFYFNTEKITSGEASSLLLEAAQKAQKMYKKTPLMLFKDFSKNFVTKFQPEKYRAFFRFSVQPNMILAIKSHWITYEIYLADFSKKYRMRAKTARKKSADIDKKKLTLDALASLQTQMQVLYQNVAEHAPFNTFFLPKHHFYEMKKVLRENFVVFGYFLNDTLVGFCTQILNGDEIDTYFLGYEKTLQKEKQLYLNMLLDMTEFAIENQFKKVIFGRTALEIKSTIGAEPVEIFGLIRHQNSAINVFMKNIFSAVNPQPEWIQRHPFK